MKAIFRILFEIIIMMFCLSRSLAQQPDFQFEYTCSDQLGHAGYDILEVAANETKDNFILLASSEVNMHPFYYETDSVFSNEILKVSHNGELLGVLSVGEDGRFSFITRLFEDPFNANCYLAIGKIHDNDGHYDKPLMVEFDKNLNLLWQREIDLPETYRKYFIGFHALVDSHGEFLCFTTPAELLPDGNINGSDIYPIYFRLSANGDLLAIYEYPFLSPPLYGAHGNLFEYQDGSGDCGQIVMSRINEVVCVPYLTRLNRNLDLVSRMEMPLSITENEPYYQHIGLAFDPYSQCISQPDGSFVLGTMGNLVRQYSPNETTYDNVIAMVRFDNDGNVLNYSTIGQGEAGYENDSIKVLAENKGVSIIDDDGFYFCYSVGDPQGFGYDWVNRFVLVRTDVNFNIIWKRYWNKYTPEFGLCVYWPYSIVSTADKGCLVSGQSYKSNRLSHRVFALKFFSDGSLSIPEAEAFIRPYMYYPNPAQDQLHLQYSPDVQPKQVELYDMLGRLVRTQHSDLEYIDLQGLSAGQYLMKVTLEDGKAYSDKVVKE